MTWKLTLAIPRETLAQQVMLKTVQAAVVEIAGGATEWAGAGIWRAPDGSIANEWVLVMLVTGLSYYQTQRLVKIVREAAKQAKERAIWYDLAPDTATIESLTEAKDATV